MSSVSEEIDVSDLEKGLYNLFRHVFITNCELDKASVTEEELGTLEELEPLEVLENFKDLALELLKFKRENVNSDVAELAEKSEQFESMLQKLEGEIRDHIRVEHQLRLHNENIQSKLDETETKLEKHKQEIKRIRNQSSSQTNSKHFEEKTTNQIEKPTKKQKENPDKVRKEYEHRLADALDKNNLKLKLVEEENLNLKNRLEEKNREIEALKSNRQHQPRVVRANTKAEPLKKKTNERVIEPLHRRPKTGKRTMKNQTKKPVNDRNSPVVFAKRNLYNSRQHIRSFSEHNKQIFNKRAPSR